MTSWHHFLAVNRRKFAQDRNTRTEKFWRAVNEIPFVLAIVMVLAVTTEFGH
jgi:putative membrane protein